MKREIAEKWIQDLRTTDATQCKQKLHDGVGYCCLGRLCVVLGLEFSPDPIEWHNDKWQLPKEHQQTDWCREDLPLTIVALAGLQSQIGKISNLSITLAEYNDNGATFEQIANIIENHWQDL